MHINLIVAASANGVIGRDGGLPWHLPDDFAYFKRVTMGKPVVMGRRTFESIGRPLPGRRNIVLSRRRGYVADGAEVCADLDEAMRLVAEAPELFVIGGGELYRAALPVADRIYLTRVDCEVDGDTYFDIPEDGWTMTVIDRHAADERHACAFEFRRYERS